MTTISTAGLLTGGACHEVPSIMTARELTRFFADHNATFKYSAGEGEKETVLIEMDDPKKCLKKEYRTSVELPKSTLILSINACRAVAFSETPVGIEIRCDLFKVYIYNTALESWKNETPFTDNTGRVVAFEKYVPHSQETKKDLKEIAGWDAWGFNGAKNKMRGLELFSFIPHLGSVSGHTYIQYHNVEPNVADTVRKAKSYLDTLHASLIFCDGAYLIHIVNYDHNLEKESVLQEFRGRFQGISFKLAIWQEKGCNSLSSFTNGNLIIDVNNTFTLLPGKVLVDMVKQNMFLKSAPFIEPVD